jgi:hypothetical protein
VGPTGFRAELEHQFDVAKLILQTGGEGLSGIGENLG